VSSHTQVGVLDWLGQRLRREVVMDRRAVSVIGVSATVVCLTLGAYARVPLPFSPVPITLQTFFVLVAGAALGPRLGSLSTSLYLLLGTLGLPIFTGAWLGPTTGYLVGFVAAAWLVAALTARVPRVSTLRLVGAMLAGNTVLLLCGTAWLALTLRLGAGEALAIGFAPFVVGDLLKLAAAAAFCRGYRDRLRALFP